MDNEKQSVYLATKVDKNRRVLPNGGETPSQEGNPRDMSVRKGKPLVDWKRLPWGADKLNRRSMSDFVALPNKTGNGNAASQKPIDRPRKPSLTGFKTHSGAGKSLDMDKQSISLAAPKDVFQLNSNKRITDRSSTDQLTAAQSPRATSDVDLSIKEDDDKIEELKRKLDGQEAKRKEYYKVKDRMDREMETVIENTEREHDRLMKLKVEKRKMEADRDRMLADVYATKMEAKNFETSLYAEAARYEELLEAFDTLKTTIENWQSSCPASFSLLLHLQEKLKKCLVDSMEPNTCGSAVRIPHLDFKKTYFGLDDSDNWSDSSPVMSPSDLFKSYQDPTPDRIPQPVKSASAETTFKNNRELGATDTEKSISRKEKKKFSRFQRLRKFFRNLFRNNKTWPTK